MTCIEAKLVAYCSLMHATFEADRDVRHDDLLPSSGSFGNASKTDFLVSLLFLPLFLYIKHRRILF
jgi:hypothetical protein